MKAICSERELLEMKCKEQGLKAQEKSPACDLFVLQWESIGIHWTGIVGWAVGMLGLIFEDMIELDPNLTFNCHLNVSGLLHQLNNSESYIFVWALGEEFLWFPGLWNSILNVVKSIFKGRGQLCSVLGVHHKDDIGVPGLFIIFFLYMPPFAGGVASLRWLLERTFANNRRPTNISYLLRRDFNQFLIGYVMTWNREIEKFHNVT